MQCGSNDGCRRKGRLDGSDGCIGRGRGQRPWAVICAFWSSPPGQSNNQKVPPGSRRGHDRRRTTVSVAQFGWCRQRRANDRPTWASIRRFHLGSRRGGLAKPSLDLSCPAYYCTHHCVPNIYCVVSGGGWPGAMRTKSKVRHLAAACAQSDDVVPAKDKGERFLGGPDLEGCRHNLPPQLGSAASIPAARRGVERAAGRKRWAARRRCDVAAAHSLNQRIREAQAKSAVSRCSSATVASPASQRPRLAVWGELTEQPGAAAKFDRAWNPPPFVGRPGAKHPASWHAWNLLPAS